MNYFAFHIGDYAVDMRYATLMEDLAYRRMLDLYYSKEEPLQGGPEEIAENIGMRDHAHEVTRILSKFFYQKDGAWHKDRCDEEILKARAAAERARENGQKGGRPPLEKTKRKRAQKPASNPTGSKQEATSIPEKSESKAPNPNPINQSSSAPIGAGAAAPMGDTTGVLNPPSSFPPADEPAAPPAPLLPTMAPTPAPAPLPTADGLFSATTGPFIPRPMSAFTDMKAEIWGVGKDWLSWCGVNDKTAGNMIGKWMRDARDPQIVRDAIFAGIEAKTLDPKPFVTKIITEANKGRGRQQYPGDLKGMDYTPPSDFIEGFPEADLMRDWDEGRAM